MANFGAIGKQVSSPFIQAIGVNQRVTLAPNYSIPVIIGSRSIAVSFRFNPTGRIPVTSMQFISGTANDKVDSVRIAQPNPDNVPGLGRRLSFFAM